MRIASCCLFDVVVVLAERGEPVGGGLAVDDDAGDFGEGGEGDGGAGAELGVVEEEEGLLGLVDHAALDAGLGVVDLAEAAGGVEADAGEEELGDVEALEGLLGEGADPGAGGAVEDAAGGDDADVLEAPEADGGGEGIGDDGEGDVGEDAGDLVDGGAGVEGDDVVGLEVADGVAGDLLLEGEVGGLADVEGLVAAGLGDGDSAAVGADEAAFTGELLQVAADGLLGDGEAGGEGGDADAADGLQAVEDGLLTLLGKQRAVGGGGRHVRFGLMHVRKSVISC